MSEIPECPITKAPLKDPVMDPEGNTYEKSAILEWLAAHGTSPITRTPLAPSQLIPNRALKDLIEKKEQETKMNTSNSKITLPYRTECLSDDQIKVEVAVSKKATHTIVSIEGPDVDETFPVHICCVIDTSGSMGDLATIKNESGSSESDGLTLLDIVKHATKVIIESLGPKDKMSIVEFNSESKCVLLPTIMDDQGKDAAKTALEALEANGGTYLAKGIKHAIDVSNSVGKSLFSSIFILTGTSYSR